MKIILQTLDIKASPALELLVEKNFRRLHELPVPIIRAEVIVGEDIVENLPGKFCNVRLITSDTDYLVAQRAATVEKAIEATAIELYKKIRKEYIRNNP